MPLNIKDIPIVLSYDTVATNNTKRKKIYLC